MVNTECNSSWLRYESSCYLLYNASLVTPGQTWNDSRLICQGYGGDLLKYDTENESAFISGLFKDPKVYANRYWIGKEVYLLKVLNVLLLIASMKNLGDFTIMRNCLDCWGWEITKYFTILFHQFFFNRIVYFNFKNSNFKFIQ